MSQCGYCRRDAYGELIPVVVASRGKRFEAYAHKSCIPKWRRVSQVTTPHDANERAKARMAERAYEERKRANPKRCGCGEPIDRHSDYCVRCAKRYADHSSRGKLTHEQVAEIRSLAGRYPQTELGRRYNVDNSTISLIVNGKIWVNR